MREKDPETTSPATKAVWESLSRQLNSPHLEEVARDTENQAKIILDMLDGYVNPSATMTQSQATSVANLIFDVWSIRPYAPKSEELMTLACYINSCKA